MVDNVGVIAIEYTEFVPNSYRGVTATCGKDRNCKSFCTGDVTVDYILAFNYLVEMGCSEIMHSSSVDNFLIDDKGYKWIEDGESGRIAKIVSKNP